MKKLALLLACVTLLSVSGVYATWRYAVGDPVPVSGGFTHSATEFEYREIVYITDVVPVAGSGTAVSTSFMHSVLTSSVTVPQGTELTFRITVYNNSRVEQGYDAVVSQLSEAHSGYDNDAITFTLAGLKRPYTVDGTMANDVTRIPSKQRHEFEITFKFKEGVTDFSNATLNSVLDFIFKPFNEIDPEHFTSPVDGALEAFKKILNTPADHDRLKGIMDQTSGTGSYVGNVVGSSSNDTKVLAELFDGNLNLMLTDPNTGQLVKTNLTCMIKKEDLDGDKKDEMTIYMTPDDLSKESLWSTIDNVYVGVFTQVTDANGKTTWEQLGDLYHGTATCNDYDSNIFNGMDRSLNTDSWKSSQAYHGVKKSSTIEKVIEGYKKQN